MKKNTNTNTNSKSAKAAKRGRPMILPWETMKAKDWQNYTDSEIVQGFAKAGFNCSQPNVFNRRKGLIMKARLGDLDRGAIKYDENTFLCTRKANCRAEAKNIEALAEKFKKD